MEQQTHKSNSTRQAELECAFENLEQRDLEVLLEALAPLGGERAVELRDALIAYRDYQVAVGYWE